MEIFDRLLKFDSEPDRPLFCQRLQIIWEEQGIFCQSYPTITNQILDLYKLHHLVQEKQGYLEITTNRGWKEISNVLGFGDSGSAAYSVKRNYVRLGLLAYECQFDRAGIDPRSVIELSEMPHTTKKRKRGNNSSTRAIVKVNRDNYFQTNKQQIQAPEHDDIKKSPSIDTSSFRFIPQQIPIHDLQYFAYLLRAGWLADSNKYLDTLLVWLSDQRTACYFNLKTLPGLFNAIMEQYIACLYELFGEAFLQSSITNDCYVDWFLELKFRVNDGAIGPNSDQERLEELFFGTHRYIIKRLMTESKKSRSNVSDNNKQHTDRYHSIMVRCSCLTTIIRNLSFIEENEYLANDRRLLDILQRMLNCQHDHMHKIFDYESDLYQQYCPNCSDRMNMDDMQTELSDHSTMEVDNTTPSNDFFQRFTKIPADIKLDDPLSCINDCDQQQLMYLLDNTFVTLSNLSTFIEFRYCHSMTRYRFINTIIHWIICSLSFANEPFISMLMEDNKFPLISPKQISITPRQISLQILAKLCTNEINVDFILIDLNFNQIKSLNHALLSFMNTTNQEDINREYCLIIICSLCKRNRQIIEFFCSHINCIELIFNYLEFYEYNQQQYLIATLTSCYNATSSIPINIPINHSNDMMIDSCIQLLVLFAPIKENNYLKLFEYKIVDMLSSIYFEQRILKAFADILYIMKS